MHIAIDARKAFDSGIGTYIRSVVPRVVALLDDVDFSVFVTRGEAGLHTYLDARRVRAIEMNAPPLGLAEQRELRRHLNADTLFWATSLAHPIFARTPLFATVHDAAQLALGRSGGFGAGIRSASRVYLASLARGARALVVNSEFTRSELARLVGIRAGLPVTVTPLGVEAEWFSACAAPRAGGALPYFVCVGNVRPHKNLATLVKAFVQAADRLPHELVIVGQQGRFRSADTGIAEPAHASGSRVRFTGHVPDAELRNLVAGADALVFPSLYEGFGLPLLEAMAAGCPVIASRAGALPEVGGDCAAYFDPRSVQDLVDRLLENAALTPEQRQRVAERGIAHARSHTWERTAELTAQALRAALAGSQFRPDSD